MLIQWNRAVGSAALALAAALLFSLAACGQTKNPDTDATSGESIGDSVSVVPFEEGGGDTPATTEAVSVTTTTTATTTVAAPQEPMDSDFVRVRDYLPETEVELMYATDRNFTGEVIYDFSEAWLRYGTVKKLQKAQSRFAEQGYHIKIWDAFRPVSAQFKLWEICPDPIYVSNPNKGFSSHSRGNTVDITLADADGVELLMPTGFDNFTPLADRDYSDVADQTALANVTLLEQTMKSCGFKPYSGEWWHFSDNDTYEVAENFEPKD